MSKFLPHKKTINPAQGHTRVEKELISQECNYSSKTLRNRQIDILHKIDRIDNSMQWRIGRKDGLTNACPGEENVFKANGGLRTFKKPSKFGTSFYCVLYILRTCGRAFKIVHFGIVRLPPVN